MTVLITGAGGQLGQTLLHTAPQGLECQGRTSAAIDITAPDLTERIADSGAKLVINTAAYTAVDKAEGEGRERAFAVNAIGSGNLAAACAELDIRLIHISTDFIFDGSACDGKGGRPYTVDAQPRPLGVYAASKWEGEQRVRAALPGALILRTAWVYSRFGGNFVKTMLRLMGERDTLSVVSDQIGTPTWTVTLAEAIWAFAARSDLGGTYHFTDAGAASWYDFAVAIQEEAQALGLLQRAIPVRPIGSDDYPVPARRPAFSVLDKTATYRDLGLAPVHWRVALRRMLQDYRQSLQANSLETKSL